MGGGWPPCVHLLNTLSSFYSLSIKKTSLSGLRGLCWGGPGGSWLKRSKLTQGLWATLQAPSGLPRSSMGLPDVLVRLCSRCLSWACLARLAMYLTRLWLREELLRKGGISSSSCPASESFPHWAKSLLVRGSTSVSLLSCSVRSFWGFLRVFPSWRLGLTMKLRLMVRYLLSKLQMMSSEVRSPRLLDFELLSMSFAEGVVDLLEPAEAARVEDCFKPSMYNLLHVWRLCMSRLGSFSAIKGLGCNSSSGSHISPSRRLGLDLLLLTSETLQATMVDRGWLVLLANNTWLSELSRAALRQVRLFLERLGKDKSITVSLDEMLEDDDTLSRWLLGSSLLQSLSFKVASRETSGTTDGLSFFITAFICPSLLVLLTGVLSPVCMFRPMSLSNTPFNACILWELWVAVVSFTASVSRVCRVFISGMLGSVTAFCTTAPSSWSGNGGASHPMSR